MIDELRALSAIRERFKNVSKSVAIGVGDDAAAVNINPGSYLVVSIDSHVSDVHFRKENISPKLLARRSVAVSVSDIAAMGGVPKYILSSIGFSEEEDELYLDQLLEGFSLAEDEFEIELIGGNLTKAKELIIDITVLGEADPDNIVKRFGAEVHDLVYVTGSLGDSSLGLKLIESEIDKKLCKSLIDRHLIPIPRLKIGRDLAKRGIASSMIDVSDGLILDLERITVDQGLGAIIFLEKIPLSNSYIEYINEYVDDTYSLALSGGEDYELLFTSPRGNEKEIELLSNEYQIPITEIGYINGGNLVTVLDSKGEKVLIKKRGHIHF